MATVLQLVSRSLRLLGVLDANMVPAAEDMATAITALNAMMARWEANGLAVGWAAVDSAVDTLPVPAEAEEAVAYNLACKLASEYGVQPRQDVVTEARDGLAALRRDRIVSAPITVCSDLPRSHGNWNIYTDEPV